MDVIEKAKELGLAIQQDPRYEAFMQMQAAYENDRELVGLLDNFEKVKGELIAENQKEEKDAVKMAALNETMRSFYQEIVENGTMQQFQAAKNELDRLMREVNGIINFSVTGEEPCSPDKCAGCSGCPGPGRRKFLQRVCQRMHS